MLNTLYKFPCLITKKPLVKCSPGIAESCCSQVPNSMF